ncbi:hypothetical protein Bpfe_017349, partial [Biomphalaria pfeifferi]
HKLDVIGISISPGVEKKVELLTRLVLHLYSCSPASAARVLFICHPNVDLTFGQDSTKLATGSQRLDFLAHQTYSSNLSRLPLCLFAGKPREPTPRIVTGSTWLEMRKHGLIEPLWVPETFSSLMVSALLRGVCAGGKRWSGRCDARNFECHPTEEMKWLDRCSHYYECKMIKQRIFFP